MHFYFLNPKSLMPSLKSSVRGCVLAHKHYRGFTLTLVKSQLCAVISHRVELCDLVVEHQTQGGLGFEHNCHQVMSLGKTN